MKEFRQHPLPSPLPELTAQMVDGKRHYTTPEGFVFPSVTTVLSILSKEGIEKWRQSVGDDKADEISEHAANRGTELHAIIESYLKNEPLTFPEDIKSKVRIMFNRIKRILSNVDDVIAQEIPLYSTSLCVAGRCDCIALYNGKLSIIDFKSATKAKKKEWIKAYFLQATAYSIMFEERTGFKAKQIVIIISGEEDFSCQVFVENRDDFIEELHQVIDQFIAEAQAA